MFVTDSERGRGDGEIEVEDGGTDAAGDVAELRDDIDSWLSTRDSACTVSVGFVKFRGTWHTVEDIYNIDWDGLFIERLSRVV